MMAIRKMGKQMYMQIVLIPQVTIEQHLKIHHSEILNIITETSFSPFYAAAARFFQTIYTTTSSHC